MPCRHCAITPTSSCRSPCPRTCCWPPSARLSAKSRAARLALLAAEPVLAIGARTQTTSRSAPCGSASGAPRHRPRGVDPDAQPRQPGAVARTPRAGESDRAARMVAPRCSSTTCKDTRISEGDTDDRRDQTGWSESVRPAVIYAHSLARRAQGSPQHPPRAAMVAVPGSGPGLPFPVAVIHRRLLADPLRDQIDEQIEGKPAGDQRLCPRGWISSGTWSPT